MSHGHTISDTDTHFVISPVTRAITNNSGKLILMQNDHNSERFTFELPRYIDAHDMSLCNSVQVHYINTDSSTREKTTGIYDVDDLRIDSAAENEDTVVCSWLISQNATKYAGTLNFIIRFACIGENSKIDYDWHTAIYSGISVSNGIANSEAVATEYADILEKWKADLIASGGTDSSVGDLADLETTDKTNIVSAINEVKNTCMDMVDRTTGQKYRMYIDNGKILAEEVTE